MESSTEIERISEFSKKYSAISTYLGYKKFQTDKPRVLLFNSEGWIVADIIDAFKKLEYSFQIINVKHLDPENKNLRLDEYLKFHKILIQSLIDFKPDFILTINHAAFDSLGLLTKILDQFSIPFVSWFVDSPLYIMKNPEIQKSDNLYVFSWEKTFIERLKKLQFKNLFFLPLGSNPDIFNNDSNSNNINSSLSCDVSFIGSTNHEEVMNRGKGLFLTDDFQTLKTESINAQIENPSKPMNIIISENDKLNLMESLDEEEKLNYEVWCVLSATEFYRKKIAGLLAHNFNFKIFGDINWKVDFPDNYIKEIDYYKELPTVYKHSKIVVNVTSFQMNSAINQRAFDASLSGGFLISDYRYDYDELFGYNIFPTFHSDSELISKIKFYLSNENERTNKLLSLKNIVLEKHTYVHRIQEMFNVLKMNYTEK